ncbi:MAG: dephospho-CoA kinase [Nanoarchaeota archaeon]|nr:dephospho-CoA kinase [Nanoarchaeota archaeon]MBU1322347.1 dephospho-CoA kinase [Nanoarchaeota archaeon]MBU1598205.1 dephospho-CoA kinase [Nanoarchaeota archaeon]MBU2440970.1 dephospho-CoA kinase [Nanoarchaeota archaeon]
MKQKNAVYALSADPIHKGHLYNIETAAKTELFDNIYVAIAAGGNSSKKYMFSPEERVWLAKKTIAPLDLDNVIIESFSGMMAHYAYERNAKTLIRGSRIGSDFEYEQKLAEYNQKYGLITFVVPSIKEIGDLSSTFLKEIIKSGGLLLDHKPGSQPINHTHVTVKQALEERVQNVSLIGVTGNMGAGKTTYCAELEKVGRAAGLDITHYDVDKKVHGFYRSDSPAFLNVYEQIKNLFGIDACQSDQINREIFAPIVWGDEEKRNKLNKILFEPYLIEFEKTIANNQGIVLFDAAYLVEYQMMDWVNNNVILVRCDEKERSKRVMNRDGINLDEFNKKTKIQLFSEEQKKEILRKQEKDQHGFFYEVDSQKPNFEEIISLLKKNFPMFKNK